MSKDIINFNEYKAKKVMEQLVVKDKELFIALLKKPFVEYDENDENLFKEIDVIHPFMIFEKHFMLIVKFRDVDYVIHNMGKRFEYIGTLQEIIEKGIF